MRIPSESSVRSENTFWFHHSSENGSSGKSGVTVHKADGSAHQTGPGGIVECHLELDFRPYLTSQILSKLTARWTYFTSYPISTSHYESIAGFFQLRTSCQFWAIRFKPSCRKKNKILRVKISKLTFWDFRITLNKQEFPKNQRKYVCLSCGWFFLARSKPLGMINTIQKRSSRRFFHVAWLCFQNQQRKS